MDKWALGVTLLLLGMLTCFVVLGLLSLLIKLINRFFPHVQVSPAHASPLPAGNNSTATVEEVNDSKAGEEALPPRLVAAIAAALAVATENPGQWVVTGVRRITQASREALGTIPAWSQFGRQQLISTRMKHSDREGSWHK